MYIGYDVYMYICTRTSDVYASHSLNSPNIYNTIINTSEVYASKQP